ncbi:MAG: hypothetical protein HYY41_01295 [Chloroflexi bacterium]|nr:hypothetical protein [Chloroflexota bacterium]
MAISQEFDLQKALDRIKTDMAIEDALANASEVMELDEIFAQVNIQDEMYRRGYYAGWRASLKFYKERNAKRRESIHQKYVELCKRLVLHDAGKAWK